MKNNPKVSVVMAAYNCGPFVKESIESILNQTFEDFEFIIIDDHSKDNTYSIIKDYARRDKRIKIFRNKTNLQVARTLNKGVSFAKAELIARMDADDISYPKRLELQYNFLIKHPKVAVVGSDMAIMNKDGQIVSKREYSSKSRELKRIIFRYSPFAHPSVVFRKIVFEKFGGYDPKMVPCEDIDLWFKIGSEYEFSNIKKTLLKYRMIISSNSHKKLKELELLGFRIKIKAITRYGYEVSFEDLIFNVLQFLSLWFMPPYFRITFYDFLRSRKII